MTIRELVVRLGIQTDPRGFERAQRGLATIRNSALSLGRVFLTGAVAYGFKRMLDVASDIEETANKFGAVFGKQVGPVVQKQLDDISKRTGATSMQLQEMSSNIGALIKPALGSAEAAGDMAASVAELALDISSFNNVTSEDALIALRSGLIGSAEPLQRFGVDVRVAALQQEALSQGITQSIQSMTEGQRVALRYAAIQKQLGMQGATGDATRTAQGFANASRNLWAALKEIVGIIMGFLLPAVTKLVNKTRVIVDRMRAWFIENKALVQQRVDKFIERFGRVVSATATFFGRVIDATTDWYDALGDVGKTLVKIGMLAAGLALVLLLPGAPIILLLALIGLLIEDFETWRKDGDSIIGDIVNAFKSLGQTVKKWSDQFVGWMDGNAAAMRRVGEAAAITAAIIGVGMVAANAAAVKSWIALQAFALKYYAVIGAGEAKALALRLAAAAKVKAAWLATQAAMVAGIAGIVALGALIVFIVQDIIAMLRGQESFFKTLVDGFWDLVDSLGGILPAIKEMLATAFQAWLEFFGMSRKKAKAWADEIARVVTKAIDILTKPLQMVFKAGEWIGEKVGIFDVGATPGAAGAGPAVTAPARITAAPRAAGAQASMVDRSRNEFRFEVYQQPGQDERQLAEEFVTLIDQARQRELRQTSYDYALEGAT